MKTKNGIGIEVSRMSDAEIWLQIARESLARFGTALPPGLGSIVASGAVEQDRDGTPPTPAVKKDSETHTCPRCGHTGPIVPDFGLRKLRGKMQKQSYCRNCRVELSKETHRRRALARKNAKAIKSA